MQRPPVSGAVPSRASTRQLARLTEGRATKCRAKLGTAILAAALGLGAAFLTPSQALAASSGGGMGGRSFGSATSTSSSRSPSSSGSSRSTFASSSSSSSAGGSSAGAATAMHRASAATQTAPRASSTPPRPAFGSTGGDSASVVAALCRPGHPHAPPPSTEAVPSAVGPSGVSSSDERASSILPSHFKRRQEERRAVRQFPAHVVKATAAMPESPPAAVTAAATPDDIAASQSTGVISLHPGVVAFARVASAAMAFRILGASCSRQRGWKRSDAALIWAMGVISGELYGLGILTAASASARAAVAPFVANMDVILILWTFVAVSHFQLAKATHGILRSSIAAWKKAPWRRKNRGYWRSRP